MSWSVAKHAISYDCAKWKNKICVESLGKDERIKKKKATLSWPISFFLRQNIQLSSWPKEHIISAG